MTLEERINQLENRIDNLQASFIQAQKNMIPVTEKADSAPTASQVENITPCKLTKTAYIEDTEITFDGVPQGNLTVFFDGDYEAERQADRVVIHFEALEEVKDITIMIQ